MNKLYLEQGNLKVRVFGRGVAQLEVPLRMTRCCAAMFIEAIQNRQGLMISCPEEIAYRMGFINKAQLKTLGEELRGNSYGAYLLEIV
ncbi:MAG: hypothetical protein U0V48_11590 [Anaerolineales bacterium]